MNADDVIEFWFTADAKRRNTLWWGKDPRLDREIGERFGSLRESAIAGALQDWEATPRGRLALIVLVDQFSRNLFRGDARAFAHDALARRWTLDGLALGHDRALDADQRMFFYLPLEHSESLADQDRCVALFRQLAQDGGDPGITKFAERHREIVARFGRFPHRNAALGRASTPEEIAFLKEPNSSF